MQVLQPGQNTAIQSLRLVVSVAAEPRQLLDVAITAAFLLNSDGKALDSSMFVMAGRPSGASYLVADASGGAFTLDLEAVPASVAKILVVAAIPGGPRSPVTFGAFGVLTTLVNAGSGAQLLTFPLPLS